MSAVERAVTNAREGLDVATDVETSPRFTTAWLFGPKLDLLAFVGPAVLALVLVAVGRLLGIRSTPPWAFLFCVVMVDVAHVHATVFRVYLDPAEVRRRWVLYLGTPVVAYAIGVALHARYGAIGFWRVLAYIAVWHFIRQQIGWVALYRARAGERGDPTRRLDAILDPLAVYAAALYPILAWHTRLPRRFSWFTPGDFVAGLPSFVERVARPLWLLILALFVARQVQLAVRPSPKSGGVNVGKCIVVLTTFGLWWLGIVALQDDYSFTVTNVLPHGIPYFVLIAAYARKRYSDPDAPKATVATLLLRGGFVVAFGVLVAVALIEEGIWDRFVWHDHEIVFGEGSILHPSALAWLVPLLALPQAVHYVLDGLIWKRATNPALIRYL